MLYSDFDVSLQENNHSGFMSGANYTNWMWILRKNNFLNNWEIVRHGV